MTSYDGQKITYDSSGNPLQYRAGWNFKWQNDRALSEMSNLKRNINAKFKYNEYGIRISKIVSTSENGQITTKTTDFCLNDMQILSKKISTVVTDSKGKTVSSTTDTITWTFGYFEANLGFTYKDETYYYVKNAQGDVVGILDKCYQPLANYIYNSWGKLVSITDQNNNDVTQDLTHIGNINPLRYRGYYYDNETQLYYLNTRYYDPNTCRFLNADENPESGDNLFAYCLNNPVNYSDYDGREPVSAATVVLVVGATIGVLGGSVVGNAIAKHLKLSGRHYWLCVSGSATLLGVVGYFAAPAVFAAIKPLVIQAIATCTVIFNVTHAWALKILDVSQVYVNQALRLIDIKSVKFSQTALNHLNNDRVIPVSTLIDCIKTGKAVPDPQGVVNRVMYYTTMWKNGKIYNIEVLVNWSSKTVEHYLYKAGK